jgi:Phage tail tube protein, GTA-gp10
LSDAANPHRGEASLLVRGRERLLRPSFSALVAAEEELGPLFALVDRAASGQFRLTELATLFWHCLAEREEIVREDVSAAVVDCGLARCARPLRALVAQILQGKE